MLKKVNDFIKEHQLTRPGELIIIGVSGGPDSMALLHIMNQLKKELSFSIAAVHLNHGLREEAQDEEDFVRESCHNMSVPFYFQRVDIMEMALQEKKSIEEMGRDYRYQYFYQLMHDIRADRIATAHHQDDVAETVLLHLLRGAGIKGLRGIMPLKGRIIRPLLSLSKNDIIAYLGNNNIGYCIDKSNYDSTYLRNRVRHSLLPQLQENFNPRIVENLNQLANIAREENEVMQGETDNLWKKVAIKEDKNLIILNKEILNTLPPAYQRRLIIKALSSLKGESGWTMKDIQSIRQLARKEGSSKKLHLQKGILVKLAYNELIFSDHQAQSVFFNYQVSIPGQLTVPEIGETFVFKLVNKEHFAPKDNAIILDYDKLGKDICIRSRRPGDFFRPRGLDGRKRIKEFFIDIKLPEAQRDKIPLLASDNEIYIIFGLRISHSVSISQKTKRFLMIKREKR